MLKSLVTHQWLIIQLSNEMKIHVVEGGSTLVKVACIFIPQKKTDKKYFTMQSLKTNLKTLIKKYLIFCLLSIDTNAGNGALRQVLEMDKLFFGYTRIYM